MLTNLDLISILEFKARSKIFILASGKGNMKIVHYYIIENELY